MTVSAKLLNHATGSDMMDAAGVLRAAGRLIVNPKWFAMYAAVTMAEASIDMLEDDIKLTEESLTRELIAERAKDFTVDFLFDFKCAIEKALNDPEFIKVTIEELRMKKYDGDTEFRIADVDLALDFNFKNCR